MGIIFFALQLYHIWLHRYRTRPSLYYLWWFPDFLRLRVYGNYDSAYQIEIFWLMTSMSSTIAFASPMMRLSIPQGLFLHETIAFCKGHSVARYVCSLTRLTHFTHSLCKALFYYTCFVCRLCSRAGSLASLTPSWDGWNSWICIHAVNAFHGKKRVFGRH